MLPFYTICKHWNCADEECDKDKLAYDEDAKADTFRRQPPQPQGRSVLRSVTGDLGFPRAEMSEFIRDNPNRRLSHAGVAIGDFALDP